MTTKEEEFEVELPEDNEPETLRMPNQNSSKTPVRNALANASVSAAHVSPIVCGIICALLSGELETSIRERLVNYRRPADVLIAHAKATIQVMHRFELMGA